MTHRGIASLVDACPGLEHLNIGKGWVHLRATAFTCIFYTHLEPRCPSPGACKPAMRAGKCLQVKVESLQGLAARRPGLRLAACHYLDS